MLQLHRCAFASFLCRKGSNKCARLETGKSYLCAMYSCIPYHQYIHCKKNSGNIRAFMIELLEAMIHFSKL